MVHYWSTDCNRGRWIFTKQKSSHFVGDLDGRCEGLAEGLRVGAKHLIDKVPQCKTNQHYHIIQSCDVIVSIRYQRPVE